MIHAHNLHMRFGQIHALHDASFKASQGEILALLGPNGAGKSTIMKILTTYLCPTSGTATICGLDTRKDALLVRTKTGYLPENPPLYLHMEVGEYLDFVARARNLRGEILRKRLAWAVENTGLTAVLRRPLRELSKGYRQRAALAQALVHDPEVIILDEPFTGLDPHQILEIRALIQNLAATRTILFSTHVLQEAEVMAHRVAVINQGCIRGQGTLDELAAQSGLHSGGLAVVRGAQEEILAAAKEIASIETAAISVTEDGWTALRFTSQNPETALEELARLCAAQNWPLRELRLTRPALEDIFLALTRQAGNTPLQ